MYYMRVAGSIILNMIIMCLDRRRCVKVETVVVEVYIFLHRHKQVNSFQKIEESSRLEPTHMSKTHFVIHAYRGCQIHSTFSQVDIITCTK